MIRRHPRLALSIAALLAAGILAAWQPEWLRYRSISDWETTWESLNVSVDSLPPYRYSNSWSASSEQTTVAWNGDSSLAQQTVDGYVDLTASSFSGCDPGVVRLTDSTLVPVALGQTTCIVRSGPLVDTLRLEVRERDGRWVIVESKGRLAS
jgi:hypothetical protein